MAPFARAAVASSVDEATASPAVAPPIADGIGKSYTIAKVGVFVPDGDIGSLDDGIGAELIFGRALLPFLALEGQIGYLAADGRFGSTDLDVWAIPMFVNARVSVPILIFEPYAGVGIGGVYADYEAAGSFSGNDFVAAWDAFIGLEVGLGRLAIGAEYKYLQTDDTDRGFAIEGATTSLFMSLPF